jgi:hypothetical protein
MRAHEFLSEAPLGQGIFKYTDPVRNRITKFINRITNGEPFTIQNKDGTQRNVIFDKSQIDTILDALKNNQLPKKLKTTDNEFINFGSIVKDIGFGGGRDNETVEKGQIAGIDQQIKDLLQKSGESEVEISIGPGGRTVMAAGAIKAQKGIKADAVIVNSNSEPAAWISLKSAPGPKAIAGWGGITEKPFNEHPEVKSFIETAKTLFGKQIPNKTSVGRKINDIALKNQIVFGKKFGEQPGPSNVDAVMAGDPVLKGNILVGSDKTWLNGNTPSGDYDPVFNITYKGDRSNEGIGGARISVQADKGRVWKSIDDELAKIQEPANVQKSPAPQPAGGQDDLATIKKNAGIKQASPSRPVAIDPKPALNVSKPQMGQEPV